MKLLILSQWYRPEPDIKVHLLGRDLVAPGHQVTAMTGFPNYPQGRIYPGYQRLWQAMTGIPATLETCETWCIKSQRRQIGRRLWRVLRRI